ncbi:hypothetical protein UFOVP391_24 [uncultured Caudovirales phage]|uniref:Uncharacterized protein n=1 Tax=uncultured Caudovirales phage TaxID=2100421 RepID=A0A6J7X0X3_9CAUD|nr:hypothetical protein UFOVP391_24 [uncultured Caudovirales phage]
MANEVEIPLKLSGVTSLKAELRQLKAAIADASDPEQMAALAARAGEVADRIKDANEAVNVFASGSKFEQISNSFGGIRDSIMSLDFEEASDKAKVFAKNLGGLNAADISKSMKGLTSTITTMGGAFIKLGAQILVNPIFLLVAVITAIVVAVVMFLKKIGVLDAIFNAITKALKPLIDGFKQLTEWLGLSTAASDDAAERVQKNNEKIAESSKKRVEQQTKSIDQEIQLAQSLGKDTEDLEINKTKVTEREAKLRVKEAEKGLKDLQKKTGKLADEERERLKKQVQDENAIIKQARVDRQVILNKAASEEKQKQAEEDKKAAEEAATRAKEAAKKYRDGANAIQAEINAANKLVVDSGKTQAQKEIDDIKAKYAALIAEAKKYKKDITALEQAQSLEINNVRKAEAAETETIQTKSAASAISTLVSTRNQQLQVEGESNMKRFQEQQQYNDAVLAAEESLAQAKLGAVKGLISGLTDLAGENKKLANAMFLVDKALAIGEIIVNTQKEISGYASNPLWTALPDGGASLKIPAIAAAKVRAATSIGTIVASSISKFMNGGGASVSTPSGGGGGGGTTATASSVPSFVPGNLYGQGNAANNTGSASGVETNTMFTVNAVVSETEITGVQNKVNKILKNAVL